MTLVEILVEFKHGVDTYYPGEVIKVDTALADFWCRAGWVKDTSGTIPTGTPKADEVILLETHDLSQSTFNEVV
jgi:hypothetical protein